MKTNNHLDKSERESDRQFLHNALMVLDKKLDTLIQMSNSTPADDALKRQSMTPSRVVPKSVVNISQAQNQIAVDKQNLNPQQVPVSQRERKEIEDMQIKMLTYNDARARGYPHEAALKEAGLPPGFQIKN